MSNVSPLLKSDTRVMVTIICVWVHSRDLGVVFCGREKWMSGRWNSFLTGLRVWFHTWQPMWIQLAAWTRDPICGTTQHTKKYYEEHLYFELWSSTVLSDLGQSDASLSDDHSVEWPTADICCPWHTSVIRHWSYIIVLKSVLIIAPPAHFTSSSFTFFALLSKQFVM